LRAIRIRRGQTAFRIALRKRYGDACVVTGCTVVDLLEAAHIVPYRGAPDNDPANGLLLRADIHTLFDLELLGVEPGTLEIHLHPALSRTEYAVLAGTTLRCESQRPSPTAIEHRWTSFLVSAVERKAGHR
jgi:putative restriction endonuclease